MNQPAPLAAHVPQVEKKSVLPMNQALHVGDTLYSKNGLFFAGVQPDGNFCVYRSDMDKGGVWLWGSQVTGDGGKFYAVLQSDGNFCVYYGAEPVEHPRWLWGTQQLAGGGQFFLVLQDDGNLCIYKGKGLADRGELVWNSGNTDSVEKITEIIGLVYDLDQRQQKTDGKSNLYNETVSNKTPQPQIVTLSGSASATETSAWSDSLGFLTNVKTSFNPGVPYITANGKVVISLDAGNFVWNGSTTVTKTWNFSTPVSVPANSAVSAEVSATRSTLIVPYTQTVALEYKSGVKVKTKIDGTYKGSQCHDFTVSFTPVSSTGHASTPSTRPLEITAESLA